MAVRAMPGSERAVALRTVPLMSFDPLLALASAGLGACSLIVLHGAAPHYVSRQAVYLVVGFALMLVASRLDYWRLREIKWLLYPMMLLSILLVIALGGAVNGSSRAIAIAGVSFQASELGKLLLIVFLAAIVADSPRKTSATELTLKVMGYALVPAALVIAEPDLGSGLVYVVIAFAILYIAGIPARQLVALAVLGTVGLLFALVIAPAVGLHVLKHYEEQRLTGFLSPSQNPNSYDHQQVESVIGVGAGEGTGRGGGATQTTLGLVGTEAPTDFIFTVVGERLGFAGGAFVLSLYALIVWRTLRIVANAKNLFAALIAAGAVAMLMFQVFVNVGMAVGIMPITGVTLPLLSYGGSSVLTTFLTLGLLQSIYGQARAASAPRGRALRV